MQTEFSFLVMWCILLCYQWLLTQCCWLYVIAYVLIDVVGCDGIGVHWWIAMNDHRQQWHGLFSLTQCVASLQLSQLESHLVSQFTNQHDNPLSYQVVNLWSTIYIPCLYMVSCIWCPVYGVVRVTKVVKRQSSIILILMLIRTIQTMGVWYHSGKGSNENVIQSSNRLVYGWYWWYTEYLAESKAKQVSYLSLESNEIVTGPSFCKLTYNHSIHITTHTWHIQKSIRIYINHSINNLHVTAEFAYLCSGLTNVCSNVWYHLVIHHTSVSP